MTNFKLEKIFPVLTFSNVEDAKHRINEVRRECPGSTLVLARGPLGHFFADTQGYFDHLVKTAQLIGFKVVDTFPPKE